MRIVLGIAAGALMLLQAGAYAQDQAAGQQACGNDVFALCQQAIPDKGRIAACLRANYSKVSRPCRTYMASYGKHKGSRSASRHYKRRHHYSSRHHHKHTSNEG